MNIFKKIKRELETHREAGLARMRAEREAEVRESVGIREAGGAIWITVDGVAVRRMRYSESHADIMRAVMETRLAAVAYWRQTHGYGGPKPEPEEEEELPDIEDLQWEEL